MLNVTEAQAEKPIGVLKRAIDAAENSNQAGENAVVLFAAAPDLLEALERLLDDCGETMPDGYVENSIHSNEVNNARTAIAKARGQ